MGVSHRHCPECKAGNCHVGQNRQRVYVNMRTGRVANAREWARSEAMCLSVKPVVCRRCEGTGRRRQQGCFGSRDVGECTFCNGEGRLAEEGLQRLSILDFM